MTPGNGTTGIIYPTIELGGVTYTVKFTRGTLMYRLGRLGNQTAISNLSDPAKNIAALLDVLHACIADSYGGTPEQLADLVYSENKILTVDAVIAEALKKVFPSQSAAAVAGAPVQ